MSRNTGALPLLFAVIVVFYAGSPAAVMAGYERIGVVLLLFAISLMIVGLVMAAVWWRADARARRIRPVIPLEAADLVLPEYAPPPRWRHKRRAAVAASLGSVACLGAAGWFWWQLRSVLLVAVPPGIPWESWMFFASVLTGSLLGAGALLLSRGRSVVGWLASIANGLVVVSWLCSHVGD